MGYVRVLAPLFTLGGDGRRAYGYHVGVGPSPSARLGLEPKCMPFGLLLGEGRMGFAPAVA